MGFNYKEYSTFQDVCARYHIGSKDAERIQSVAKSEGYTEKALCFIASLSEDKLSRFIGDSRFAGIFINELRIRALKPGDPRWAKKKRKQ